MFLESIYTICLDIMGQQLKIGDHSAATVRYTQKCTYDSR